MHVALQRTISIVVPSNQHEGVSLLLHPKANILFCDSNIFVVSLHTADNLAFDSLVGRPLFVNPNRRLLAPNRRSLVPNRRLLATNRRLLVPNRRLVAIKKGCVYLRICASSYACVRASTHMYVHLQIRLWIYAHVHVPTHRYVHLRMCTCTYACVCEYTNMHTYLRLCGHSITGDCKCAP